MQKAVSSQPKVYPLQLLADIQIDPEHIAAPIELPPSQQSAQLVRVDASVENLPDLGTVEVPTGKLPLNEQSERGDAVMEILPVFDAPVEVPPVQRTLQGVQSELVDGVMQLLPVLDTPVELPPGQQRALYASGDVPPLLEPQQPPLVMPEIQPEEAQFSPL
ncbi:hypothetical protein BC829DRAFT_403024 [Chytridium lagenaria]|nr:hypothetical protein BC829DRAFT_403024 [Chytridium lagenaria]